MAERAPGTKPATCSGRSGAPRVLLIVGIAFLRAAIPRAAHAQEDSDPPTETPTTIALSSGLVATDHPNDDGTAIDLKWTLSPDDMPDRKPRVVRGYKIFRTLAKGQEREELVQVAYNVADHTDRTCRPGVDYLYEVVAIGGGRAQSSPARLEKPVHGVLQ